MNLILHYFDMPALDLYSNQKNEISFLTDSYKLYFVVDVLSYHIYELQRRFEFQVTCGCHIVEDLIIFLFPFCG